MTRSTSSPKRSSAREEQIKFYGRTDRFTHGLVYGPDAVNGLVFQWQNGKQVTVWPKKVAEGTLKYPSFIKLPK